MAGGVGLLQVLQDDIHRIQDIASHAWILENPQDEGHAKIHQNLGHVPHQDHQPPGLGDAVHLGALKEPPELNELHQLLTVVLRVESLGLHLHQHCLAHVQVPLFPIELDFLLPQHLIEAKEVIGVGSMGHHLVEVLLLSGLGLGPLSIEVGTDLGESFL
jgi:hypothetical protein